MMGSDKLNSSVTKHKSWLELRRGWLWSFWKVYSIPTLAVIPNRDGHDKREQFIEYSLCLRHSPRYHGVRPPNSRRWQWENDRSKSFVFPQIELLPPTTQPRLKSNNFLPALAAQISIWGQKTFNLMMTAIEKHHTGVINCWIWRATVFSCLAPVEWDFVGHLIRGGACGGVREEEDEARVMLRILVANLNRKQVWALCRWEGPVTFLMMTGVLCCEGPNDHSLCHPWLPLNMTPWQIMPSNYC